MVIIDARSRWIVPSSSAGSSERLVSVTTQAPPRCGIIAPIHTPVPCISGAQGMDTGCSPRSNIALTIGAISAASAVGVRPITGNELSTNEAVVPPIA